MNAYLWSAAIVLLVGLGLAGWLTFGGRSAPNQPDDYGGVVVGLVLAVISAGVAIVLALIGLLVKI